MKEQRPPLPAFAAGTPVAIALASGAVVDEMEGRMPPVSTAEAIHDGRGQENVGSVGAELLSLVDGYIDPCDLS